MPPKRVSALGCLAPTRKLFNMILVTGNKGFIGTALTKTMGEWGGCDLKTGEDYGDLSGNQYDTVIHLAAHVSVTESVLNPLKYFDNNLMKLYTFLSKNYIGRIIFTSTGGAMYGNNMDAKEDDATWENCTSAYAQSKFLGEIMIRRAVPNHTILRLGNVIGEGEDNRGESNCYTHFRQDDPITLFGGLQLRDFVSVDVVVEAIKRAYNNEIYGTFNIGSGEGTKIKNIAEDFAHKRGVKIIEKPPREGEVQRIVLNVSRAKSLNLI